MAASEQGDEDDIVASVLCIFDSFGRRESASDMLSDP